MQLGGGRWKLHAHDEFRISDVNSYRICLNIQMCSSICVEPYLAAGEQYDPVVNSMSMVLIYMPFEAFIFLSLKFFYCQHILS